jgi:hypothetical protein
MCSYLHGSTHTAAVSQSPIGGENMWENVATSLVARSQKQSHGKDDMLSVVFLFLLISSS